MTTDLNLQFIREKIGQLRTAVMYCMSNSTNRLPNDVVTAIKVDEEGQLWFLCRGPHPAPDGQGRTCGEGLGLPGRAEGPRHQGLA